MRNGHAAEKTKATCCLNAMLYPGLYPERKRTLRRTLVKSQVESVIQLSIMPVLISQFDKCTMVMYNIHMTESRMKVYVNFL